MEVDLLKKTRAGSVPSLMFLAQDDGIERVAERSLMPGSYFKSLCPALADVVRGMEAGLVAIWQPGSSPVVAIEYTVFFKLAPHRIRQNRINYLVVYADHHHAVIRQDAAKLIQPGELHIRR